MSTNKTLPQFLDKSDPRYQKWKISLKNRKSPWNTGKTKNNDKRLLKMSNTFKRKKIDNFAHWRNKRKKLGFVPTKSSAIPKDQYAATLIGLILGDGHIQQFPRTQKLTVSLGTDKPDLIDFTFNLILYTFHKKPTVYYSKTSKVAQVYIYRNYLSNQLQIPTGNKRWAAVTFPEWIWINNKFVIGCLKGLFEADGSLSVHPPTSTYNFAFRNMNTSLNNQVQQALQILNFHPEIRETSIRLRKKDEVKSFEKLITFREYKQSLPGRLMVGHSALNAVI